MSEYERKWRDYESGPPPADPTGPHHHIGSGAPKCDEALTMLHTLAREHGLELELSVQGGKPLGPRDATYRKLSRLIVRKDIEPIVIVDVQRAKGLGPATRQALDRLEQLEAA